MLPLDLHVLSLPLAFILSQDQTLHCKKSSCFLINGYCFLTLGTSEYQPTCPLPWFLLFQRSFLFPSTALYSSRLTRLVPSVLGLQKYYLFLYYQIFFTLFFT